MIGTELQRISLVARWGLALIFFYHGLVPKILWLSPGEASMIAAHGFESIDRVAKLAGIAEIVLAALLLIVRNRPWPLYVAALALAGLLIDVAVTEPLLLVQAFNPVSINLAALCLCLIAWMAERNSA